MKKLLLTAAAIMVAVGAFAQGTINFANRTFGADPVDAPIFNTDGTTRLAGSDFMAQLYFGVDGTAAGSLTAHSDPPTAFSTVEGYFLDANARALPGINPGVPAAVQVRAWDASGGATSWESATIRSLETDGYLGSVVTGGTGVPPGPPANMLGLQSFSLVPEPSTFALGLIGAGALFFARRRK